jgi:hypothetical protein
MMCNYENVGTRGFVIACCDVEGMRTVSRTVSEEPRGLEEVVD